MYSDRRLELSKSFCFYVDKMKDKNGIDVLCSVLSRNLIISSCI